MDLTSIQSLLETWFIIMIPIISGITEVIKRFIPENLALKYTPVLSVVVAEGLSLLILGANRQGIVTGLIMGLSASGLYSTVTNPFKKPS